MPFSKNLPPESAIILAGGTGSRLGALTARTPKPLLPVAGRLFIHHLLDFLSGRNVRRVVLATGYLADEFETALGRGYRDIALSYSREEAPLGTGGAIVRALGGLADPSVFVLNGDTYFPVDLAALAARHAATGVALSLALRRIPDVARYGQVTLDGDRVTALHEKGGQGPGLINGGVYLVDRAALLADAPAGPFSLERDLFPRWVQRGALAGFVSDAYFIDIGIPDDLRRAQHDLT
jgi:D-glycero-alpha-D-manno-heptose 1-phosphate guanylyltransferase